MKNNTPCPCSQPGPCPAYQNLQLVGRLWELCNDKTELGEKYRKHWAEKYGLQPKLPGILAQAANLAKATTEHVKAGLPTTDSATKEYRLNQCKNCDRCVKNTENPDDQGKWRCAECGCFVQTKAGWAEQKCPLGKWELPVIQAEPPKSGGCGCSKKQ